GLSSGLSFFVLAIQTLSESFSLAFQVLRFRAFPFRRFRLYQILSGLTSSQRGLSSGLLGPSDT
ncbi:hypothetical protein ACFVHW_34380, partial [Streptomyces sp. NPDC127110]|uniref:hypothetical protein n=1 Tax=Streptomyces sp. NPDC127110 TaxID=3345362 RepID=UPI00363B2336